MEEGEMRKMERKNEGRDREQSEKIKERSNGRVIIFLEYLD